jgi:4,5-DOPA dioxygenase extradiol
MTTELMPAVFVSHGAPLVAIERGPYRDALAAFGKTLRPAGIVVVSAHWEANLPVRINFAQRHTTMYDFRGFPPELYEIRYEAPGSPTGAQRVEEMLKAGGWDTAREMKRGLDHGVWAPLRLIYPDGDVPVVQVSMPAGVGPRRLYELGEALRPIRQEGWIVLGTGGIVHNLMLVNFDAREGVVDRWAGDFDQWVWRCVQEKDHRAIIDYRKQPNAELAVPVNDPGHFEAVFVTLGIGGTTAQVQSIYEGFTYANLSMRCFVLR